MNRNFAEMEKAIFASPRRNEKAKGCGSTEISLPVVFSKTRQTIRLRGINHV